MRNPFNFLFGSQDSSSDNSGVAEIFPLLVLKDAFIESDLITTYVKILSDTMERTHGLSSKETALLSDSCVQSDSSKGLISLIAEAMANMTDLFLVYKAGVIRKATYEEQKKIQEDYATKTESAEGVFISFRKYRRTEMLRIYSNFEYCVLGSLNKMLNISKAVQIKVNELRTSVSLNDSAVAKAQAKSIAEALRCGKDVLIDAKDMIENATPDTSSAEKAIVFLDAKRAFILSLPLSYISGEQTAGIGSTGEADMRAVERGLKQYYVSIVRPILLAVFKTETEFKSQDFREMNTALETVRTFDLVSDDYLTSDAKKEIVARLFDLNPEEQEKIRKKEEKLRDKEAPESGVTPPAPDKKETVEA